MTSRAAPRTAQSPVLDRRDRELQILEHIAEWMDGRYIDPILGFLLPGIGDVIGGVIGLFGIVVAIRLRAHPVVIARMLLNLALDSIVGSIPLLGDAMDVVFHAHTKNLELLRDRDSFGVQPTDWLIVAAALLLFLAALALPFVLAIYVVRHVG